jgi:dipeptidyl aminopeptidase/acylaminoacyl peptidase
VEIWLFRGVAVAALMCASMAGAQSRTLAEDAAAFGAREAVSAPDLSPDGSTILYLTPGPGRKTVAVVGNLATGQFNKTLSTDGSPESLQWCHYASQSRAVCRFAGFVRWTGAVDNGIPVYFGRMIAVDLDGSKPKLLGQAETNSDAGLRQTDGEIIDWLPDANGEVLVNRLYVPEAGTTGKLVYRNKRGWGVDRVDVTSLKSDTVEAPREAADYMTDGLGHVRLMSVSGARNSGIFTGDISYFYRTQGSRDWKDLFSGNYRDFSPLAIDAATDSLYVLKKKNGRYALYTIRLDGSKAETLVAENPRVDIDDVVRFGEGQKVIGYTYVEEKRETVYFDPEFRELANSLSKALPKTPLIEFADASRDGRKLLIFAGSDTDPGRYYLFDRDKKALAPLMIARPELEGRTLASVKPVTVTASDGTPIPAYLTLPPGKDPKGLPAVVLPHGGPESRDVWGFDWLPQFLAARGYAVIQPEFRGSGGFGDIWLSQNGFQGWRTSIGDISASAKWLGAQGIADPNRIAILGWSYGGYAALQSAATEPSLYKAVIAIAPVTDLSLLKDQAESYTDADLVRREIGSGPHVQQGSPLRNAAAITAPVLLVHGKMDANVFYSQSQKMDSALRGAGKQSELLSFEGLDHQLEDSTARTQMLTRIGELLERTIGR